MPSRISTYRPGNTFVTYIVHVAHVRELVELHWKRLGDARVVDEPDQRRLARLQLLQDVGDAGLDFLLNYWGRWCARLWQVAQAHPFRGGLSVAILAILAKCMYAKGRADPHTPHQSQTKPIHTPTPTGLATSMMTGTSVGSPSELSASTSFCFRTVA